MNSAAKLTVIVLFNVLLFLVMMFWFNKTGIDINTKLADNSGNLKFVFDFITLLFLGLLVNLKLFSFKSEKRKLIDKLIDSIDLKTKHNPKNIKRKHA